MLFAGSLPEASRRTRSRSRSSACAFFGREYLLLLEHLNLVGQFLNLPANVQGRLAAGRQAAVGAIRAAARKPTLASNSSHCRSEPPRSDGIGTHATRSRQSPISVSPAAINRPPRHPCPSNTARKASRRGQFADGQQRADEGRNDQSQSTPRAPTVRREIRPAARPRPRPRSWSTRRKASATPASPKWRSGGVGAGRSAHSSHGTTCSSPPRRNYPVNCQPFYPNMRVIASNSGCRSRLWSVRRPSVNRIEAKSTAKAAQLRRRHPRNTWALHPWRRLLPKIICRRQSLGVRSPCRPGAPCQS